MRPLDLHRRRGLVQYTPVVSHPLQRLFKRPKTRSYADVAVRSCSINGVGLLAFFLSALSPETTEPNSLIYLAYVAGVVLAVGLLALAVGLIRGRRTQEALNR